MVATAAAEAGGVATVVGWEGRVVGVNKLQKVSQKLWYRHGSRSR